MRRPSVPAAAAVLAALTAALLQQTGLVTAAAAVLAALAAALLQQTKVYYRILQYPDKVVRIRISCQIRVYPVGSA